MADLEKIRINYKKSKLDFDNLIDNPITFFIKWMDAALAVDVLEANACVLSTISHDQKPSSRVVLLKNISQDGFTFFTNYNSNKSMDIDNNNNVALNFYWPKLERQVRIYGNAFQINPEDSDNYFESRPRESQMGAWLSNQSTVIDFNYDFTDYLADLQEKFKDKNVSRPKDWGGYIVRPYKIEFWQGRPSRLHDRILYELNENIWNISRLAP